MEHIFQRKLEGSPSVWPSANCTFTGNAETYAKHVFLSNFQRTYAICGLKLRWHEYGLQLINIVDLIVTPSSNHKYH